MKLAAFVLIVISMCVGVVGAITAYLPPLALPDERLTGLTLNDPAGNSSSDARAAVPMARKNDVLTLELLGQLRSAGVERVRVKEFAFARWPEWWVFGLGCTGLAVGAVLVRTANRAASVERASMQGGAQGVRRSPAETLAALAGEVDALRSRLHATGSGDDRLALMLNEIARMQQTHIATFIAARAELTGRMGLGGYARVMDTFAAAERALNRAWSAAADEVESEARASLDLAAELISQTRERV